MAWKPESHKDTIMDPIGNVCTVAFRYTSHYPALCNKYPVCKNTTILHYKSDHDTFRDPPSA